MYCNGITINCPYYRGALVLVSTLAGLAVPLYFIRLVVKVLIVRCSRNQHGSQEINEEMKKSGSPIPFSYINNCSAISIEGTIVHSCHHAFLIVVDLS